MARKAFFVANGLLGTLNDPDCWAAQLPVGNGVVDPRTTALVEAVFAAL
jgi:hypothetical protein